MATRPTWDATWLAVARSVAARSLCVRDQVGAVIVSSTNRIIASAYNGPPTGFRHEDRRCDMWCERARASFTWVQENTHAPALAVSTGDDGLLRDEDGSVIDDPYLFYTSRGYTRVESVSPCYEDCPALHAEANALSVCDRTQREGGTIYVTSHVCWNCAKLVANSGLAAVVRPAVTDLAATHRQPGRSYEFLESCGVDVYVIQRDQTT